MAHDTWILRLRLGPWLEAALLLAGLRPPAGSALGPRAAALMVRTRRLVVGATWAAETGRGGRAVFCLVVRSRTPQPWSATREAAVRPWEPIA